MAALAALAACEGRAKVKPVGEFFSEGGKGGRAPSRTPQAAEPSAKGLDRRALAAYENAKGDYLRGDLAAMQKSLEQAVQHQADFTEGWYNLGACRGNRALEAIRTEDEQGALALFRAAVDAKRKAKDLMDQGVWFVYLTEAEQQQVRDDVEAALEDAEAVLEDEESLLAAMRLMAGE
jgi:tetratricopeptide (TPR) repeat protein